MLGHRRRLRGGARRGAAASGPGRLGPPPARAAGRQRDLGLTPRRQRASRPGRVQPALHAAGPRRRARRAGRARAGAARSRSTRRPTTRSSSRRGEVISRRQLPRRAAGPGARLRHDRRGRAGLHLRATHGAAGRRAPLRPAGLPVRAPGVESGLMIAHYTAAALVNELQTLAHPSSVDTIPTSANQEDHVSMGATSALHLREAVDRAEHVLAIEALCAAQGLDFRAPLRPGAGVARAHAIDPRARAPPRRRSTAGSRHRRRARARPRRRPAGQWRHPARPMPELEFVLLDEEAVRRHPRSGPARCALPDLRLLGADRRRPRGAGGRRARRFGARQPEATTASRRRATWPGRTRCSPTVPMRSSASPSATRSSGR